MTLENILRYLEHGYVMKPEEQIETAEYIRRLQEDVKTLAETVNMQTEELVAIRRDLSNALKGLI